MRVRKRLEHKLNTLKIFTKGTSLMKLWRSIQKDMRWHYGSIQTRWIWEGGRGEGTSRACLTKKATGSVPKANMWPNQGTKRPLADGGYCAYLDLFLIYTIWKWKEREMQDIYSLKIRWSWQNSLRWARGNFPCREKVRKERKQKWEISEK